MEAFQQNHTEILRFGVGIGHGVMLGLNLIMGGLRLEKALNLCCTIGAHHSVWLAHSHSCQKKRWVEKVERQTLVLLLLFFFCFSSEF